jgi:hypothetical protein
MTCSLGFWSRHKNWWSGVTPDTETWLPHPTGLRYVSANFRAAIEVA